MADMMDIHTAVQNRLRERYQLRPVQLKHPLPERPVRALGLLKIDGEVFSTEKLLRLVFLRPTFPVYFAVRSMFLRPRVELDLPVFAGEVMRTGDRRLVIVDIHRTGKTHHDDTDLFQRMLAVRDRYPELMKHKQLEKGRIQDVFSPASCQVRIPRELDDQAMALYCEYLDIFCDLLDRSQPLEGEALDKTRRAFDLYLKTLVEHDPGVKGYKLLFGARGGVERSMDMHFAR